jgi:DNA-binding transcriptional ArsR family regulator
VKAVKLPPGTRTLRTPRELEAVASPLRVEILEHLAPAGSLSVAQLARLLERPAPLVHYHVGLLREAGLVRLAGRQAAGRRGEALFALAAPHFAVAGRPGDALAMRAALRTLGVTLRLAQREAARALRSGQVRPRGRERNVFARRLRAALSPEARARLNRLLDEIEALFTRESKRRVRALARKRAVERGDEPAALTFVLAPAGRKTQKEER